MTTGVPRVRKKSTFDILFHVQRRQPRKSKGKEANCHTTSMARPLFTQSKTKIDKRPFEHSYVREGNFQIPRVTETEPGAHKRPVKQILYLTCQLSGRGRGSGCRVTFGYFVHRSTPNPTPELVALLFMTTTRRNKTTISILKTT